MNPTIDLKVCDPRGSGKGRIFFPLLPFVLEKLLSMLWLFLFWQAMLSLFVAF